MSLQKTVSKAIIIMQEFWPDWKVTQTTVQAWCLVLEDYPPQQVEAGLLAFIKQPKKSYVKTPRPDMIVEIIERVYTTSHEEIFNEICAKANHALFPVLNMGKWIEVKWSSPEVPKLMERMGGAKYFAALKQDDLVFARSQFGKMYEKHVAKNGSIPDPETSMLTAPVSQTRIEANNG